ncbi:MAG: hypothetical protein KGL39_37340 [Patescibacteria group bacterium]|nr:hypothetical protein [Patescibacteria group bacterium]
MPKIEGEGSRLVAMRLRALAIVDLGFALANAQTLADAYEVQHYLEKEVECNGDFLCEAEPSDLGYVGDARKFRPLDEVVRRGMDERASYIRGRVLSAIEKELGD